MDVNSREPSQNIIPFRIKGVEIARFDICGNLGIGTSAPSAILDVVGNVKINGELFVNGNPLTSLTSGVVVNMDSQPVAATALNRQKKQSIPLAAGSTLATSDVIAKMSGVSVGKTQTYGVGPAQMATYGNIVVAVGDGTNSIAYSLTNPPTAASWVGIPNSAATFTTRGRNIAYANGTWVAVGDGSNSIAYSTMTPPVASSWVGIPVGTSINGVVNTFNTGGYDIAYGNGAWVAVGTATNSIAYSLANPPTAESWVGIPLTFSPTIFGSVAYGITFGNGTWVACGEGTNGIAYSTRTPPTADSWVVVPLTNVNDAGVNNTSSQWLINVIYANGVWLAAGSGTNVLSYSVENPPIAGSWMPITTGVLFGTSGRSVAYGNGTWVACGNSGTLLAYSTSRIPHSSSWVLMKGPTPSSSAEVINHVTFNAATNTWYFLGDIGTNCMFYSTATPPVPATWIGVPRNPSTFTTQAYGAAGITTNAFTAPINVARLDNKVTFPANRMIAVGGVGGSDVLARSALTPAPNGGGTISYSDDDGATWQMVPGGATNAMFSSAADIAANVSFGVGGTRGANAVAWNGEKWVAAGNGRTNSLAFSDDGGMTWSGITGKSIFSVEARDVAWNGRMWVAVGRGVNFSTAYSYDGVTWMGPVTDDVSGTPINVFSYDIAGPTVTASMSDISGGGNHVIWTGKMWVATGTRTLIAGSSPAAYYTVAYSVDGKSWTGVPESGATSTGFDMYAHGIAWNGRNFVATGRGTVNTLATFTDATATTTWQGLGNTVFSVWGRGITWGARRWMATGRGTNTVAYSTNGRNWQGCGANVFKPMRRFMAMGDTGLYTGVFSGQPQRGVAFSYSDDGVTWDTPVVNQAVEFSTPLGGATDTTRSVIFTNNILLTNAITDTASAHTSLMFSADGGASWARVPGTSDTEANGGTGMTTANNGSYSLATNPARTRFLVGGGDTGSATRKVYFSNDGFNWRNSVSSPNTSQMAWVWASLWVGGGYNRWLVGGSDAGTNANGRIMYSGDADAITAWISASPATYTGGIISCFAANTDFSVILAGIDSPVGTTIHRSVNGGANWAPSTSTFIGRVRSIAFSPSLGRWVAVGGGGGLNTIMYSNDAGNTWNVPPQGGRGGATAIFKDGSEVTRVIWDAVGGRFLAGCGSNGQTSTAALTNVFGLDATNNNPGYTMAYSADGINWTPVTVRSSDDVGAPGTSFGPFLTRCREIMALDVSGDFTPINTGYSVTWNSYANRFVATGNGTTPVVYSSDGGVTWTPANQQPPQQAVVVAGGLGAAANTTSVSPITYSIDGKTWSQAIGAKEAFGSSGAVNAIRYGQTSTAISPNGRIWVAGGTGTSSIAFSQNGIRWTPITNATTMITNVRAIAYAPADQALATTNATTSASGVGNGVWVAGGDTTNSLVFSYDGISWSEVPNSLTILSRCNAIAYGATGTGTTGVFVAGGLASSSASALDTTANMAYSTDGYNWQPIRGSGARISTGGPSISCITYGRDENGHGLWVAGAFGSSTVSILYSYNGIDWVGVVNSGASLSSNVTGIAYGVNSTTGRGLWVASVYRQTSAGYSFIFSANGRDGWTPVANTKAGLFEVNTSGATSIAYLNGVWYATGFSAGIGTGRTLAYSYEGSSGWFGVYPTTNLYGTAVTTYSTTDMRCVATTGDYAGAGTLTPIRALGWTAGVGSAYLQHPTILFGASGAGNGAAISADGGRSWGASTVSIAASAFRGGVCNDAFWNGIVWAAVGYDAVTGAKVATSKDGVTWTQIPAGSVPIAGILYSIMWNGTIWMVGGDGSPTNDLNTSSIAWSPDLAAWSGIANTDTKLRVVKRIAWNGMYWVAVGAGDVSTIMHSRDKLGLVWEDTYMSGVSVNKTAAAISSANDVVWGGGRWVAVGRANNSGGSSSGAASILYSVDTPAAPGTDAEYSIKGRRWTAVAGSAQLFPYGANSISWNGKRFVATGPASGACSTGNIIAWSADGIAWRAYSSAKTVAPGQRWVAVGSGSRACIALSADGEVWTDVSGSAVLFPDISGASAVLVSSMKTGGRAIGWNGSSLVVGGARAATTVTASSNTSAATMATTGRTTIPVCAFIGSGNGVMGGGTTNVPDASFQSLTMRASSSVFITHMDVNMREALAPWANMWLNTYTDLSATQLFQITPETQTFSSALKWNGWSWVANFGMTTFHPQTGEQYGSLWYCTDPMARVGWSVASNSAAPRILIGQGGYAALEWNGVAWLACGYDPNNNNLIYTTDKYGATGWTAVSGLVSGGGGGGGGSASFQPVCIAASSRFWVVGGSQGAATSAIYYTSDRTGATGWRAVTTTGVGASVLPSARISSVGYNGSAWICCGGGRVGTDTSGGLFHSGSISWRSDPTGANAAEDFATGWATATVSGTSGGIPPIMSATSAIASNVGTGTSATPIWMVVGEDLPGMGGAQVAYTTDITGSSDWKKPSNATLTGTTFGRLNGIAWTGYSWIVTSGAGFSRLANTTDPTAATGWNNATHGLFTPTLSTNAVTFANIPISLLTTGMPSSAGAGAGTGAMWRAGAGRAQGLLPGGGSETTSVVVRSTNGAEGTSWSQTYSRNFLIAVGGAVIRDAANGGGTNRMAYSYDGGLSWTTNTSTVLTNAVVNSLGTIRTVKYGNGIWVAGGDAVGSSVRSNNCLAWSRDGVNWVGAGGTQIFGSAGACYAVCCNDRGRWVAVGGAQLITAGTYTNTSGAIYTMAWSDDGMNWTPILGSRALFGIVCQGVTYGADASGVGMWTAIGRGTTYTGCAYSYDGKTWYLSQTSGSLFGTSVNVLTERYCQFTGLWRSISVSSTGQYQSAVVYAEGNGAYIYTSSDYGVFWTKRTQFTGDWFSISVSSTGQYQSAVIYSGGDGAYIYTSSDYGVFWTKRTQFTGEWTSISVSSTGQYQSAVVFAGGDGKYIYTSSDYGVFWTKRTQFTGAWRSISVSSTGQYQSAVIQSGGDGKYIYTSSDYGVFWTKRTQFTGDWYSISVSSTGQYQSAVINSGGDGAYIYTSSDYGVFWTKRTQFTGNWRSISVSSTGQYQSAVIDSGGDGAYIYFSSNFGETWSAAATDSRSLGVAYGKDASGVGMWVATAGRRDRDISASVANTMAYSYDGKLWRGIRASAGLSEQAWSVAYGKDGFGVGMWVAAGYDTTCGLKWSYDGVTWNATMGASGAAVWAGAAAGRRALTVYWNGSMWLASTSDTRNGEPRGGGVIAVNNASSVPGYLLYSYNGKNWLPVLAPNTYNATISASAQPSIYSVLPNPAILDFGSFYDDQAQRGVTIANTTARTVGAVMSGGVPIENVNTIVPYGRGSLTTGQVPFLLGGDSGLVETGAGVVGGAGAGAPPVTSDLASTTASISTSTDGGITWRAVPNSTKVMTKVNKILCDETTQQIVAVGTGNYSVATSTPARAANADGWVGVFGSRMTDTRAGLFEKYGTAASWFGGAKMWIASGRAQTRRGSSLAVSVNGTVWQDAKIVSQVAAGAALGGRGGGLTSRTTGGAATTTVVTPITITTTTTATVPNPDVALYTFTTFMFDEAGATGRTGPDLSACRTRYASTAPTATWAQNSSYLNMTTNGIQEWKVPATGSYTIRAVGAAGGGAGGGFGADMTGTFSLTKNEVVKILVGQRGTLGVGVRSYNSGGGGGGSFVTKSDNTILVIAGGGGGGQGDISSIDRSPGIPANTTQNGTSTYNDGGGINGNGGLSGITNGPASGGGGFHTSGGNGEAGTGGTSFLSGGTGGNAGGDGGTNVGGVLHSGGNGGFGGGGGGWANAFVRGGGGGGYSGGQGGSASSLDGGGGGGGSTNNGTSTVNVISTTLTQGSVTITPNFTMPPATITETTTTSTTSSTSTTTTTPLTFNSSVIPYTSAATPLLTYTDSAAAFSTQVGSVAVNSQYNRAVVGGSGVQFVAGGRGGTGLVVSNDGQNWTAAGATTVFQTPTNATTRTGSGGFDASFGTVALTQRLTTPATYPSGDWRSVSLSRTGQYQTAVISGGNIWTSSDYGVTWTERTTGATRTWRVVSLSSTGQYQSAVIEPGNIWTSSDFGVTWTSRATSLNSSWVSLSSTGQYQSASIWGGNIWTSSDYGANWTSRATSLSWNGISLSSTGQYQTGLVSGGNIWISSDFGVSWSERTTGAVRNWRSVSLSSTGQYQTATIVSGNIWTSSDYGINWTERSTGTTRDWRVVSLSSTGQYQTAVVNSGGNIWISYDFGVTWTERGTGEPRNWISVSISSTGQYQTAVVESAGANIFTSTDFGVTWVQRSTATRTNAFTRIKSSASGQYQLATSGPTGNTNGQLYVSSDYGRTWMPRRGLATWLGGAVSATGGVMMAMTPAPPTIIKLNNALSYSPILYLDATNSSSYNGSTWTNLGSLGGNVVMTNMGTFDPTDNGGSFNFNGSSNFGTLTVASTSLTAGTYVAVVKPPTTSNNWRTIMDWADDNLFMGLSGIGNYNFKFITGSLRQDSGYALTPDTWYHLLVTFTSGGNVNFYVNGLLVGTATGETFSKTSSLIGIGCGASSATTGNELWVGKISSLAIYNRVLTASEIYNLYTSNPPSLLRSTDYGNTFTDIPNTTLTGSAYWRAIATTNSAAIQTALAHGSTIYRSTDYGSTWNSSAAVDVVGILTTEFSSVASPTYAWKSIAMSSSDAKYQTGVVTNGQIYVNSNYGRGTWTAVDSSRNWTGVAMSADGRYQSAVVTSGAIYYNSTFGTGTWTAISSPAPGFTWTGIAVSSADGKYQTAVASGATNIYVNSNFGVGTWTAKEGARNWFGVAMSATGQYQTAINRGGFIYIDASFGVAASWTPVDFQRDWASVAMSSTGQYQTAVVAGGKIYANSNYGAHGAWTETESDRAWISVAVSGATGRYQTAVAQNAQIYINSNFGVGAWFAVDSSRNWVSVTVSADGKYQSAVVATSGQVYFSRDFGATWSTTAGLDIMGNRWQDVAVAAETGAVQVTCVSGGYLYVSSDTGANWVSTTVSIDGVSPQATNRAWQAAAVSANGQYGLACVNNGYLYRSVNSGATWVSSDINIDTNGIQASPRWWQDVGISANGKYQVACSLNSGNIFYSKNYGASWTSLTAAGTRAWSSVALSENGSTISATTNDATGGVWVYSMPDDQYYRAAVVANSGSTTTPATVRAITYGNSGTGAATDGYWVAGADASANSLAYSSNGVDWTAVVGSKTTLFNAVNGVAYGADTSGTPMWVAVGLPFVGSVPGTTAYSIAYSYNMATWTGVRNAANFTGQGNHVAYGQDEFGAGVWVAVGQGDGVLSANLGDSAFGASNGTAGGTLFYSYDGANWAAGTGAGVFAVSGTDIAWGVDASGVGMWVATGIGYTDPLTGVVVPGGQVAHSTNGRVWTLIRTSAPITPAMTPVTLTATSRIHAIPFPPASSGVTAPVYGTDWGQLGLDILGTQADERSGTSVSISADGTTVAIGSFTFDVTGSNDGRTRIYKYNGTLWNPLGADILGNQSDENSGISVSLSADGTTVAIGSSGFNTTSNDEGRTRVYKYNGTSWIQLGSDISGNQANENSGYSVSLSADGNTVAIGSYSYDYNAGWNEGRTRIFRFNGTSWNPLGLDISGNQNGEYTGYSVSLSADGNTVAIGSNNYDIAANANEGRTRIFRFNGTSWNPLGLDISGNQFSEQSGYSVSLSADGQTVAIGSILYDVTGSNNEGRTRVYKYNGTSWIQLGMDISGNQANENSGYSVSLSADGNTVAIGSYLYDIAANANEGRTRIYKYNGTSWVQLGLDITGNQLQENSGWSVSLSADGNTVAIGSRYYDKAGGPTNANTDEGRVRVYKLTNFNPVTFSSSNPAIAEINNGLLLIKEGASGTATITATQPATPPFTAAPVTVQGTLTVSGTTYTLVYHTFYPILTPFPGAVAGDSPCVAYGRGGSQGAGAPLWMVANGGSGTNVFAMSSAPTTLGAWSVVASNAPSANAPFPTCNSIAYSNGVWVASNNTGATNIIARSTNGGSTWTPVTASSVSGILTGAAALGANAFCNYSLAVADFSNDTNLRSWVAIQGTKNFFFEGGVSAVATVTPDVSAAVYNAAWWVAGGVGLAGVASIGSTTDPSGATGWTKATSPAIANLAGINAIAFSPFTQRWLAVGAGASGSLGTNILYSSDASGTNWAAGAVTSALTPVITLNTCVWNQPPTSASSAGRWLIGGTRNDGVGADSASLYISTDVSGAATPWTPITGTGAILSQVYSLAFNGQVWIAAGAPATDNGSTSTLMRTTTDPTGATGWQGIPATNISTSGFDTAARSVTWNADQQMWVATGENTGSAADASFSSVIYSRDINGAPGTWRTVRESNSVCFSGEGTGVAFTGDKWFAVGDNGSGGSGGGSGSVIVSTTGSNAANAADASWNPITHGTTLTRASDIAYTGRRLVATGSGAGASSGIIYSSDGTGDNGTWTSSPAGTFTDASGGASSITFEASYEGTGRVVATGRSATNALSVSRDGGVSWNTPAAPSVQYSSSNTFDTTTTPLFTTGGNSVAYVGNDTLFAGGGNDVHWTGKRWVATGRNSGAASAAAAPVTVSSSAGAVEIVNNNTAPVATSEDGITWQCVRASQAPTPLTEGAFVATNSRIGATPLINSQITIADGGDTESTMDYGGGSGTGVAQIDIIAELTPVSNAAASIAGTVGVIGAAGNGGANGVGHVTTPSFDNTAFTITTRPM